jgi:hypothetical protein
MQFVFPGFLFALFAISIPILIHLFHFRRFRKIYFPNVTFLQHLSEESRKQSRLKHLLVLLSRILAIAALVFAFAQPFIPRDNARISQMGNSVAVYIDNSFSMGSLGSAGSLLDQAKETARQVASLYQPSDEFLLLTNDFEGRHQRFLSKEEFLLLVNEVQESPSVTGISDVLDRKAELLWQATKDSRSSYIISDFQKSTTAVEEIKADTTFSVFFVPLVAQKAGNVFIDSLWFESPVKLLGQPVTLKLSIVNDNDIYLENQPVRLFIDGVQRAVASWDAPPNASTEVELTWTINTAGIHHGKVEIVDHPVTFDDQMFFSYQATSRVPVLSIDQGRASSFLRALFGRDSTFVFANMPASSVNFSSFGQYDLIILNNLASISPGLQRELQEFTRQGGSLLVFPGNSIEASSYAELLRPMSADTYGDLDTSSMRVTAINELHEVFAGVFENLPDNIDLPVANKYYQMQRQTASTGQYLLQLQNGHNFLSSYSYGRGKVFLSAVPLEETFSNFPRHPVFVPALVNIALQSQAYEPLYYIVGQNQPVNIRGMNPGRDQVFHLIGDQLEIIPEQRPGANFIRLFFHDQVKQAGSFWLNLSGESFSGLAFNYDRRESLMQTWSPGELQGMILDMGLSNFSVIRSREAGFQDAFEDFRLGRKLWKYFVLMALFFLLLEVALLRFWK